ncbi:MAG: GTPase, partial [Oscillospiraceae bacterium]
MQETQSIFVAIVGRPNVGKSSLINKLVGEKVAIVTSKPQTTRTRITGIITKNAVQYVFLDTPGIHSAHTKLGERMDKVSHDSVAEVDAVLMLFEPYGVLN